MAAINGSLPPTSTDVSGSEPHVFDKKTRAAAMKRLAFHVGLSSLGLWLAFVLALAVDSSFASRVNQKDDDWKYVGTSKEGVKLYYSPDRITERNSLIQTWFKGVHPVSDQKISHNISLSEFNCRKGNYRIVQATVYRRDGSTRSSNQPSAWEYPLPGSGAEMELRQVCGKRLPPKRNRAQRIFAVVLRV